MKELNVVFINGEIYIVHLTEADPGFPVGGGANLPGGGANLRFCQKFPKNHMKL